MQKLETQEDEEVETSSKDTPEREQTYTRPLLRGPATMRPTPPPSTEEPEKKAESILNLSYTRGDPPAPRTALETSPPSAEDTPPGPTPGPGPPSRHTYYMDGSRDALKHGTKQN